jgi:phosphatidylinositol glycan class T
MYKCNYEFIIAILLFISGYGQEYGEIIVEMANHLQDSVLPVLYVEVLPWYIRPYLHTMKVEIKPDGLKMPSEPGF